MYRDRKRRKGGKTYVLFSSLDPRNVREKKNQDDKRAGTLFRPSTHANDNSPFLPSLLPYPSSSQNPPPFSPTQQTNKPTFVTSHRQQLYVRTIHCLYPHTFPSIHIHIPFRRPRIHSTSLPIPSHRTAQSTHNPINLTYTYPSLHGIVRSSFPDAVYRTPRHGGWIE